MFGYMLSLCALHGEGAHQQVSARGNVGQWHVQEWPTGRVLSSIAPLCRATDPALRPSFEAILPRLRSMLQAVRTH